MVTKRKKESHENCGKKYFYLFLGVTVLALIIVTSLFIIFNKRESFTSAGQASKVIPSLVPSSDSEFAKFKQCFCGGGEEQEKVV